jgi:hypothetical protein
MVGSWLAFVVFHRFIAPIIVVDPYRVGVSVENQTSARPGALKQSQTGLPRHSTRLLDVFCELFDHQITGIHQGPLF